MLSERELLRIEIVKAEEALRTENRLLSSADTWHDPLVRGGEGPRNGPSGSKTRQVQLIGRLKELRELYDSLED
jgi:hypothetical protein